MGRYSATVGSRLLMLMRSRRVSTRDIAEATGLSAATVWRITQDKPATFANVCAVADYFTISIDWLRHGH